MFYHKKLHEDCVEFQEHPFLKSWDMRCFFKQTNEHGKKRETVQLVVVLMLRTAPRSFLKENVNILYSSEL